MRLTESFQHKYYDRPSIWSENYWNEVQRNRAKMTAELLPLGIRSILDVGCGAGGITKALIPNISKIVAIDFAFTPLIQVKEPHVQVIQGDARFLPLGDETFDAVVSAELIEHLSQSARQQTLSEMARVSRKIILLTVPWREVLEYEQVKCVDCGCVFHGSYHTKSFDEPEMSSLFKGIFSVAMIKKFGPIKKRIPRSLVMLAQTFGGYAKGQPGRSLCPQCGNTDHYLSHRNSIARFLLGISSRVLPLPKLPSWMAVLYERNSRD